MTKTAYSIGDCIRHPKYGDGDVIFVGEAYIGVDFKTMGDVLLRLDAFDSALPGVGPESSPVPATPLASWPKSTFVFEPPGTEHFMGSHWSPFVHEVSDMLERLPEILEQAVIALERSDLPKPLRELPASWPRGYHLAWPGRTAGVMAVIRKEEQTNEFVSMYPFFLQCTRHRVSLLQVSVWDNGCEAQIKAELGASTITFFDTLFLFHRPWYETGGHYEFALNGIAYVAGPAKVMELPYARNPDQVAWEHLLAKRRGDPPPEVPATISLAGMAMLLPIEGWDRDDYSFRAPIKSVREFRDVLGESGWVVQATVLRSSDDTDEDIDLDIFITQRAWQGVESPQVGQDIEGQLWLQGYLAHPERND